MNGIRIELLVNEILSFREVDDIVSTLVRRYAGRSLTNAKTLLNLIPEITDKAIGHFEKKQSFTHRALWAATTLKNASKEDKRTYFAILTPLVMEICPNGNDNGCSRSESELFAEFVKLVNDKKAFSWETDKSWAERNEYADYIKLVQENTRSNNEK